MAASTEALVGIPVQRAWRDAVMFTSYGLLNNGLICVAYGAAQDICNNFGYPDATPMITLISTVAAIVAPLCLLVAPLRHAGYRTRALVACTVGLLGLLLLSWSTWALTPTAEAHTSLVGMSTALLAVFLLGLQQSLGENCACMRFRRFSKLALSCWGAGTGLAGIVPPLLYSAISHWPLYLRFMVAVPLLAIYFATCLGVYAVGRERDVVRSLMEDGVRVEPSQEDVGDGTSGAGIQITSQPRELEASYSRVRMPHAEEATSWYAWYVVAVFCGIYGLEYFIYPTLVDRATRCPSTAALGDQAYVHSWVAYNVGVTLSRGSIAFFQFRHLWLLIVLQAINVALWVVEVNVHLIQSMRTTGYALQYVWMMYVGLMGGTGYANCIRVFHCSPLIPDKQRDQWINYAFAISMMVIVASSGFGVLIESTVLTNDVVTRGCPSP